MTPFALIRFYGLGERSMCHEDGMHVWVRTIVAVIAYWCVSSFIFVPSLCFIRDCPSDPETSTSNRQTHVNTNQPESFKLRVISIYGSSSSLHLLWNKPMGSDSLIITEMPFFRHRTGGVVSITTFRIESTFLYSFHHQSFISSRFET